MSGLLWANLLDYTGKGDQAKPRSTLANAVAVLQHDPTLGPDTLWYDEFLDRVLWRDAAGVREYRDEDDTRLTVYMQQIIGMVTVHESHVASAVRYVAHQRVRHCARTHVSSVVWDEVPRLEHALEDFWGAEPSAAQPVEYLRAVSANLIIGMIARIMSPGCQLDTMVILEGAQGIGKSRSLRILGGAWYMLAAESVTSKDFYQSFAGKWLIEIGELDAMSKADREKTKIAISTPTDRYRSSYGRRAIDHPRQCVFIGTTNRSDYGNDETGLRRLWPVVCGAINCDGLAQVRDQLFAEALVRFQAGATWWEVPTSTLRVQADRQYADPWTDTVLEFIAMSDEVTSAHILLNSPLKFSLDEIGRPEQNRIGAIINLTGEWKKQTIRWNGRPAKGWKRVTVDE
jgi:putative DNA primase/helicase